MVFVVVHVGVLIVVLVAIIVVVLIVIIVTCLFVSVLVVVFVEIPLLVACGTMYVIIDIGVSTEVVAAHAISTSSFFNMQFVAQDIFVIPNIISVTLVVVGIDVGTLCESQVDLHWFAY